MPPDSEKPPVPFHADASVRRALESLYDYANNFSERVKGALQPLLEPIQKKFLHIQELCSDSSFDPERYEQYETSKGAFDIERKVLKMNRQFTRPSARILQADLDQFSLEEQSLFDPIIAAQEEFESGIQEFIDAVQDLENELLKKIHYAKEHQAPAEITNKLERLFEKLQIMNFLKEAVDNEKTVKAIEAFLKNFTGNE